MKRSLRPIDLTLAAMFAALMAIGANLTAYIKLFAGVPLTLQTFFAILAGALLGSKRGALSMVLYTVIGLIGVPVFAEFSGGLSTIYKPTFGFILSFIILAYVTGKIVESTAKPSLVTFFIATFVGLAINYIVGTNYMYVALNKGLAAAQFSYATVWSWMWIYLIKDGILTLLTAFLLPNIYAKVQKSTNISALNN